MSERLVPPDGYPPMLRRLADYLDAHNCADTAESLRGLAGVLGRITPEMIQFLRDGRYGGPLGDACDILSALLPPNTEAQR